MMNACLSEKAEEIDLHQSNTTPRSYTAHSKLFMDHRVADLVPYFPAMDPNSSQIKKKSEIDGLNTLILS